MWVTHLNGTCNNKLCTPLGPWRGFKGHVFARPSFPPLRAVNTIIFSCTNKTNWPRKSDNDEVYTHSKNFTLLSNILREITSCSNGDRGRLCCICFVHFMHCNFATEIKHQIQTCVVARLVTALFLYSFDLIFHIISFPSLRSMSLDVIVSVQIKSAMISSCSNISPPNICHVLLLTMLLPEILLLLIGYLMASLISHHWK